MRWIALVCLMLLAGCLGDDGAAPEVTEPGGSDEPVEEEMVSDDASEEPEPPGESYTAYDGRVGFTTGSSDGDQDSFEVTEGQYQSLGLFLPGDTTWSGDIRFLVMAPSGEEYVMVDTYGVKVDGGVINVGGSTTNTSEAAFEAGSWTLTVEGAGSADMHLVVEVQ